VRSPISKILSRNIDIDRQSLRGFLHLVESEYPGELLRINQPIDLRFDATALVYELEQAGKSPVVVFEKEQAIATHQTGRNSGVVHAGIYYAPGSAKAKMCRRGVELLRDYCADRGLVWDERGKLVVARNDAETGKLKELERRATANGVPGVRWLTGAELRELEPGVAGVAALLSPTTAIVDYPAIARSFADDVLRHGGQVLTGTPVTGLQRRAGEGVHVLTDDGAHRLSRLVICAGLQADLLAREAGDEASPEIIPFRGEYLRLRPHARDRVRHLIYPVPDPAYPFLGVHVTPRVDGEVDLGPNAVIALASSVPGAVAADYDVRHSSLQYEIRREARLSRDAPDKARFGFNDPRIRGL